RIVEAALLVARVIASRPVGARHLERELFFVEIRPREVETGDPDEHDPAALPAHLRGLMDRLAARGRCRHDHRADAASACERSPGRDDVRASRIHDFGAEALGQIELVRIDVDAEYSAAVRMQKLDGEQPDQAKPRYDDGLAERRLDEA